MKILKALTVCLVLPLGFMSCDKKEEDKEAFDSVSAGPKEDTHEIVFTEYFGYIEAVVDEMGLVRSEATAETFMTKTEEMEPKLRLVLERAKALPAPSDEEKAKFHAAYEEVQYRIERKQAATSLAMVENPPVPEGMAAYVQVLQEVMSGDFGKKMGEVTNGMGAIYGPDH